MKLIRKECPNPVGPIGVHHHWSVIGQDWTLAIVGFRDYDHRFFGAPVELTLNTPDHWYWFRPLERPHFLKREKV